MFGIQRTQKTTNKKTMKPNLKPNHMFEPSPCKLVLDLYSATPFFMEGGGG